MSRGDVGKLTVTVEAQVAPFERSLKRAGETTKKFARETDKAANGAMRNLNRRMDAFEKKAKKVQGGLRGGGGRFSRGPSMARGPSSRASRNSMSGIFAGAAGGAGFASVEGATRSVMDFGFETVQAAADMETMRVNFGTLVGDMERGAAIMDKALDFAARNPLTNREALDATSFLVGNIEASKLIETVRQLGDVAKGTNSRIEDLASIYVRVKVQGKLTGEELNRLTDRRIQMYGALAEVLGTTEDKVKGFVAEGKVGFAEFEKAFKSLTEEGGRFHKALDNAADTTSGKLSQLQSKIDSIKVSIGEGIIESQTFKEATALDEASKRNPRAQKATAEAYAGLVDLAVTSTSGLAGGGRMRVPKLFSDPSSIIEARADPNLFLPAETFKQYRGARPPEVEYDLSPSISPVGPGMRQLEKRQPRFFADKNAEQFEAMMRHAEDIEQTFSRTSEMLNRVMAGSGVEQSATFGRNSAIAFTEGLGPILANLRNQQGMQGTEAIVNAIEALANDVRSMATNLPKPAEFF